MHIAIYMVYGKPNYKLSIFSKLPDVREQRAPATFLLMFFTPSVLQYDHDYLGLTKQVRIQIQTEKKP